MKIAIVTPVYPPYHGGIGSVAAAHAAVLRRRGHEVIVYTPRYRSMTNPAPEGVVYLSPLIQYGNAAFVPGLVEYVKDADIIHVHYPFFGGAEVINLLRSSLHKSGAKMVMHYHMDVAGTGLRKLIFDLHAKFVMPSVIKNADAVVATSRDYFDHSLLKPFASSIESRLTIIPNGVDAKAFYPAHSRVSLKQEKGYDDDEKIILFVGGLDPAHYFKGVEYLIEALARLRETPHNWRAIIVGEGSLKSRYQDVASQLGIDHRVTFTGRVEDDDLPRYYQMADVTVLPSIDRSEAFGMVLIESLACATPIIASDLPGVRSVVTEDVGLLTPPKNIDALAGALNTFLQNEDFASQCGAAGRRAVEGKYDWEIIGTQLEELYTKLRS